MLNFVVPVETFGPNCNHPTMYIAREAAPTAAEATRKVVERIEQEFLDLNLDHWKIVAGRARLVTEAR